MFNKVVIFFYLGSISPLLLLLLMCLGLANATGAGGGPSVCPNDESASPSTQAGQKLFYLVLDVARASAASFCPDDTVLATFENDAEWKVMETLSGQGKC